MTNHQTDILIVGGGFGGVAAAQKLAQNGRDVVLVDKKDYFEVTFATLRNVANPELLGNTARKRYSDFIQGTFIQSGVEKMNENEAKLSNGDSVRFNQAIVASGSRYTSLPLAKSNNALGYTERNQEMLDEHQSLKAARMVLIIGGGLVGVELAGEIASAFPDKQVTLAHASNTLLDNSKPKAQRKALEQLTAKGVEVKLNRRFAKDDDGYRCSISNEILHPDVAYVCVGMMPNTEFLQAELPEILDTDGLIKVDLYMNVDGYDNLYALGDCANLDTRKHGYLASVQGMHLADIILKSAHGKKVKQYKKPPIVIVTTTGTDSGVATLPFGITTTQNFIVNLKQKDMGISNMYEIFSTQPDEL